MGELEEQRQLNSGPQPLSSEAPSAEIEIDPKKKPQDKKTIINFRTNDYIRKTVETPKDAPTHADPVASSSSSSSGSSSSSSSSSGAPSTKIDDVRNRMRNEASEPQSLSSSNSGGAGSDAEAPDADDCEMYADMAIELIDWVMIMLIQWYAKDAKEEEYRSDEKKKNRLKKMLAKMLMKVGKKYPIGVFFFGALILMYVPAARKAHAHKQKVDEEKAAQAAAEEASGKSKSGDSASASSGGSGSKRRRLKQDPEIVDANLEEN